MNRFSDSRRPFSWLTQVLSLALLVSVIACGGDNTVEIPQPPEPVLSSNALLSELSVSAGDLMPSFDSATTDYGIEVVFETKETTVTAITDSSAAVLTINGEQVNSGSASDSISLDVGENLIAIVVVAADGTVSNYNVGIVRAPASQDASLVSLDISEGSLLPSFVSSSLTYSVSVSNDIETINVTPSSAEASASIAVNDVDVASGEASAEIALIVGESAIDIEVTAQDGVTTQSYQIMVTRDAPLSNNADLSSLSLSVGSLTPTFSTNTLSYTSEVDFATSLLSITPVLFDTGASVTVNSVVTESGVASENINLLEGENTISVVVLAEDGVTTKTFEIIVTRQAAASFAQEIYIKSSYSEYNDQFGYDIAVSGDTLVVGVPREDGNSTGINGDESNNGFQDSGAVFVFVRSVVNGESSWVKEAYIKPSNRGPNDRFGLSVDLDGDTLVVGAALEDSAAVGVNGDENDNSALSSGAVYVFVRTNGEWSQQAYIKASNSEAGDGFGAVSISGDRIAVSTVSEDSNTTGINGDEDDNSAPGSGAVYVFARTNDVWTQQAYIKASNTQGGDRFGSDVAIDGFTLVVGAWLEASSSTGINGDQSNDDEPNSGAVYVFTETSGVWSQQAYIKSSNSERFDNFGQQVDISGDTLIVGAIGESSNATGIDGDKSNNDENLAGAVYVFSRSSGAWTETAYLKPNFINSDDRFGSAIAILGDKIVVQSIYEDSSASGINGDAADNSLIGSGAAYLFTKTNNVWQQQAYIKASNTGGADEFGLIVIGSDFLATSARLEDSDADNFDGDQGDDQGDSSSLDSGAVYIFSGDLLNN